MGLACCGGIETLSNRSCLESVCDKLGSRLYTLSSVILGGGWKKLDKEWYRQYLDHLNNLESKGKARVLWRCVELGDEVGDTGSIDTSSDSNGEPPRSCQKKGKENRPCSNSRCVSSRGMK